MTYSNCRQSIPFLNWVNSAVVSGAKLFSRSHNYKPTRARSTSATLIDNIFINNPDQVVVSGNIISDISDHFSQFCILKSMRDKIQIKKNESAGLF